MPIQTLGYDVRFMPDGWETARWTQTDRDHAFFHFGSDMPRSLDPDCWPSRFALEAFGDDASLFPGAVAVPEDTDVVLDLYGVWPDLGRMLEKRGPLAPGDEIVCVGLARRDAYGDAFAFPEIFEDPWWEETEVGTTPAPGAAEELAQCGAWEFLGFDVADAAFASALWSLDKRDPDLNGMAAKTQKFKEKINAYGLFSNLSDAVEYCALINSFLLVHAPFYVFSLQRRRA